MGVFRNGKDEIRCGRITGNSNFDGYHEVEVEENGVKVHMNIADEDVSRYARELED